MTENKINHRKWKNFLIRRDVQLPIVLANLIFLAGVTLIIIAVLLSPLYHDMLQADDLWVQHVSGNLFLILLRRIAFAMVLILTAALGHQIILSHRIYGSLVNFGHTFQRMARGDFSRKVYLRKWDFLKFEADQVNAIIDHLSQDRAQIGNHLDQMEQILAGMTKNIDYQSEIAALKQAIEASRTILTPEDATRLRSSDLPLNDRLNRENGSTHFIAS